MNQDQNLNHPLFDGDREQKPLQMKDIVEMEKLLQNSSFAHAYATLQLESKAISRVEKETILEKLDSYRNIYFQTRTMLEQHCPERLENLEKEISVKKRDLFHFHSA